MLPRMGSCRTPTEERITAEDLLINFGQASPTR
jgi:hypothetical protein